MNLGAVWGSLGCLSATGVRCSPSLSGGGGRCMTGGTGHRAQTECTRTHASLVVFPH